MSSKFFKKGDRVRMTPEAERSFPRTSRTGTVGATSRGITVSVIPDGCKWGQEFSPNFWQLIEPSEGSNGRRESSANPERPNN
jgi:hypothetical protein